MTGKQKCNTLRRIRRDIAEANALDYTERDCTHTGPCAGTCPYCEAQLRRLEEKLAEKRSLGQRIAVAGLSLGVVATNLAACDPFTRITDGIMVDTLQGDVPAPNTEQVETAVTQGELIAQTEQVENVFTTKGLLAPETDVVEPMGDIVMPVTEVMGTDTVSPPETKLPEPTMGVPPMPETTLPEPEETMIAGGIPPASALPEPSAP